MATKKPKPFTYRFLDDGPNLRLELTNATMDALKGVEILTVFLKDQESQGAGPSQAHIRFEAPLPTREGRDLKHHRLFAPAPTFFNASGCNQALRSCSLNQPRIQLDIHPRQSLRHWTILLRCLCMFEKSPFVDAGHFALGV